MSRTCDEDPLHAWFANRHTLIEWGLNNNLQRKLFSVFGNAVSYDGDHKSAISETCWEVNSPHIPSKVSVF